MTTVELFNALSGMSKLEENVKARLNVLLVDKLINEDDYQNMLGTISLALIDNDSDSAIKRHDALDTHIRDLTHEVLNSIYKL